MTFLCPVLKSKECSIFPNGAYIRLLAAQMSKALGRHKPSGSSHYFGNPLV